MGSVSPAVATHECRVSVGQFLQPPLLLHRVSHLGGQGTGVASVAATRDDKDVGDHQRAGDIEDGDVLTLLLVDDLGDRPGQFFGFDGSLLLGGGCAATGR